MRSGIDDGGCQRPVRLLGRGTGRSVSQMALMAGTLGLAMVHGTGEAGAQATDPNDVIPLFNPATQNLAQQDMARSIERMCPRLDARAEAPDRTAAETELNTVCANVSFNQGVTEDGEPAPVPGLDIAPDELDSSLQAISGEELNAVQAEVQEIGGVQGGNIRGRMSALRLGLGSGLSVAGLNVDLGDRALALQDPEAYTIRPAQFEDGFLSRVGVFVTGALKIGEKDGTGAVEGFDFDSEGVTIGADYRVSDQFAVGAAVGYSRLNVDFDDTEDSPSGQELDSDSVLLSAFATWFPTDQLFVDGIATIGWSFYDSERHVVVPSNNPDLDPIDDTATGDFDAFQYSLAGDVGYDIVLQQAKITPVFRFEYIAAEIDGFTEDPVEGSLALTYGDQDVDSFTTSLGAEAAYPFSTGVGIVQPSVRAEWVHEYLDDQDGVIIQYANDPTGTSRFEATTEDVDQDFFVLGAALTGTFAGGWAAFADYSTALDLSDYTIHAFNIGLRKEF